MLDNFATLLAELGTLLQIPLKVDENNSCLINFPKEKIDLQIEFELASQKLLIGSNISKIPPGRYRQNLFEQALKANNLDIPKGGILAFSNRNDQLVLFLRLSMQDLKAEHVMGALTPFKEKLKRWRDSIENNQLPDLVGQASSKSTSSGMFGLK